MECGSHCNAQGGVVRLEIYDRSGQLLYTEVKTVQAGYDAFEWNGRDLSGDLPGNGIYVYRIIATIGGSSVTQKGKFAIYKR